MADRCWRSSDLSLVHRHCPAALAYRLKALANGVEPDRSQYRFDVGSSAHHVIEEAYLNSERPYADVAEAVAAKLIAEGRKFEGRQEAPMAPDDVVEGRDLALRWLDLEPPAPGARVEVGLSVNRHWEMCEYRRPGARWSQILDLWQDFDGEDDHGEPVQIRRYTDWKTAWASTEKELKTWQMRGAALLLERENAETNAETDIIRIRVVNLRYGLPWEVDLDLRDPEVRDMMEGWRRDLWLILDALDQRERLAKDIKTIAQPGVRCSGCPSIVRCEAARDYYAEWGVGETPEVRATQWAAADALTRELRRYVEVDAEDEPVKLPAGGGSVGFHQQKWSRVAENAAMLLVEAWASVHGDTLGAFQASGLTVGGIKNLLKEMRKIHPDRGEEFDRIEQLAILPDARKKFGGLS